MDYEYDTNQTFNYNYLKGVGGTIMQDNSTLNSQFNSLGQAIQNLFTGDTDYRRILEQQGLQNAFEANQAEIARKWQEYMAKTSYQRTVEDLKNAGLNPYLAYGSSPNSAPSTNSPSGTGVQRQNSGSVINALVGSLVGGAFDIARQGMADSAKSALQANTNAYEFAKREQQQNFELNLQNQNSRNAVYRDNLWRDFYKNQKSPKNKNSFLNSHDRKYSDKELLEMFEDLKEQ